MSAALGAVLDLLIEKLHTIRFTHIPDSTRKILQRNGFLSYFGFLGYADHLHTTIPYQKLRPSDGRFFSEYVIGPLLNRPELPSMSEALKQKMTESIYEIFVNAQIHSETEYIYTCGQFYPNKQRIEFTITDIGVGFREKFRRRFSREISAELAIRWAVQDRHTTKEDISGGIGLALMREFIHLNNGKLQIVSGNGFYQFDVSGEQSATLDAEFPGTVVNLQFCTDDARSYALELEDGTDDIF
ncbi:MAG: ATP-binding protein [Bacteroidia bacterium]|nr:ATP-binding protein [Bacteroidia bacterium]